MIFKANERILGKMKGVQQMTWNAPNEKLAFSDEPITINISRNESGTYTVWIDVANDPEHKSHSCIFRLYNVPSLVISGSTEPGVKHIRTVREVKHAL